ADEFWHSVHVEDGLGDALVAGAFWIDVEGGHDLEPFLFEAAVSQKRGAKTADANENDRLQTVCAEQIGDHFGQLLDIVTEAASAELSEVGEVLPQLGGFNASGFGQGFA